ncbi:type VI secretion protein [Cupriavidus necator]|uniref:Type VI secretion protein n=1 Tax=Cupriavidus necator TaxID=106590 RepID=A0A1U9V210_CUPNE|nr:type VI secretion system baseplate subunit TssG [Cupriavidus necator]AQV98980.1 type VI secretion protein [Cupriavidus necator]
MEAMASDDRQPAAAVIECLAANPAGFDLFQAISLIERAMAGTQPVGRGNGAGEPVRLRGLVSLAFQPRDIGAVHKRGGERAYTLTTPVMSLAGAGGPLPLAYTEMLLERRAARDPAMGDLLDSFNHRFLSFLYRGRRKHSPALGGQRPASGTLAACLDALSNLGLQRGPAAATAPWLRHAGLLGAAPRSMAGLLAMLGDRLGLRVSGTQFSGGWLPVDASDTVRLGAAGRGQGPDGTALGRAAVLGRRAWDQAAGIRLDVQVPAVARLPDLLPGGRDHALVAGLVRAYAAQPLEVRLALHLNARQPAGLGLGARLGWTTWLAGGAQVRPAPVQLALRPHAS